MSEIGERIMSPLSEEAHAMVRTDLAGPHVGSAGGRFRYSDDIAESTQAQRSLYTHNDRIPGEAVDAIAGELQSRYPEIVEAMHSGHQGVILDKMAEGLQEKKKIVVDMNHAGLINSGIGFRAPCSALENLGVEFETVSIEGIMLPHLKVWLSKEAPPTQDQEDESGFMPTPSGVKLLSRHAFRSIPKTESTEELRAKFPDEVTAHNRLLKETFQRLMSVDEGMLILVIGSGTHDRRKPGDPSVIEMKPVAQGLIDMFIENELEVAEVAIQDIDEHPFDVTLVEGPEPVTSMEQMNRRKNRLARFMTEKVAGVSYEYSSSGLLLPN